MKGTNRTKKQLMEELEYLRRRIAELEAMEAEHKRAEQELKLGGQILDEVVHILESAIDPIFLHDAEGNFVYVNEAAARSHGYTKEELIKLNLHKLEVARSSEVGEARMKKIMEDRSAIFELEHYHKDGSILPFEIHTRPVELDGNVFFISAARDIAERKQLEEALQKSERHHRTLVENAIEGIVVTQDGKIKFVNPIVAIVSGYSIEELQSMSLKDLVHPDDEKAIIESLGKSVAPGTLHITLPFRFRTKGGEIRWIEATVVSIIWDDKAANLNLLRDITESKRAEEALRESEERLRTFFEEAPVYHYMVSPEGKILDVNKAALETLGYTREEIIGKPLVTTVYAPSSRKKAERLFIKWKEAGKIEDEELNIVTRGGDERTVLLSAHAIRDAEGKALYSISVQRDITERKRAEEELRDREAKFRYLFEHSQIANALVGLDGKIIDVNQAAADFYGYGKSEIIGKNLLEFIAPESAAKVAEAFSSGLVHTHADSMEVEAITKGGKRTFFFPGGYHTLFEGGEEKGFLISVVDVTERKRAEEALVDEATRRRLLFASARDGIVVLDEDAKVVEVNKRFAEMLGYTIEEVHELHTWDWDVQSAREELLEMMRTVDEAGAVLETRHRRKDGTVFDVDISASSALIAGQKLIFCVCRDVTERRRAEEERRQLEQKAQFASRLASVGELAAGVAHEINNPLTAVVGYASLLLDREDIPEDIRRDLEVINAGARRVAGIVGKLLVFARQTKPERKYIDINEIISATLDLRAYSLQSSNVKVILQLDPDLPKTVADPGQLQQVFLNLIVNAETEIKLGHGAGKLAIKTEKIGDNIIRISFRDNGLGIAKKNLDRIFDPFFTTRKVGEGTGLGLSLCHGIVTEHKGRIWAESQLGKGATFIVELPIVAADEQLELPEPVVKEAQKVAKARILVVDDETMVSQFVSETLTEEGHEVEAVDSAEEALEKVKDGKYQVIMLDIKMPGMSGIELYRYFQQTSPVIAERVIFITGDVMGASTTDFLSKTKASYIIKPFDAGQLKTEINRLLAKKAYGV